MLFEKDDELDVSFRCLITERDMPGVMTIENSSFEEPIGEQEMINYLKRRTVIGMIAEKDSLILGFTIYCLGKKAIQLYRLAIAEECRREKIGSKIVQLVKTKLSFQRRTFVFANVPESNLGAQLFFKSAGFKAEHIDYRPAEPEYQMFYQISDEDSERSQLLKILKRRNRIPLS
jgi:ribosomal-protein-alanine N-acetyltransferase